MTINTLHCTFKVPSLQYCVHRQHAGVALDSDLRNTCLRTKRRIVPCAMLKADSLLKCGTRRDPYIDLLLAGSASPNCKRPLHQAACNMQRTLLRCQLSVVRRAFVRPFVRPFVRSFGRLVVCLLFRAFVCGPLFDARLLIVVFRWSFVVVAV